jgi:hypothetical protein
MKGLVTSYGTQLPVTQCDVPLSIGGDGEVKCKRVIK